MNIIVCVKQVPDPEVPASKFRIDSEAKKVIPSGLPPVISIFDAMACEAACRLKDADRTGIKITVLSMGSGKVSDVVKHALSMGADDGIVLQDVAFEDSDSFGTALILSQAIRKISDYDLILCGRQSADWEAGQTGSILSDLLELPLVTIAADLENAGGKLKIRRALKDGYEVVEAETPCVVTVSGEVGQPRIPRGMDIIKAASKQVPVWNAADIEIDTTLVGAEGAHTEIVDLLIPVRGTECEMIGGETPAETSANLIARLKQAGAI